MLVNENLLYHIGSLLLLDRKCKLWLLPGYYCKHQQKTNFHTAVFNLTCDSLRWVLWAREIIDKLRTVI